MSVRIHHLNCGTMCPFSRRLMSGDGGWLESASMCCHCLLIETGQGLVLVDTGLGSGDIADPARLGGVFNRVVRPRLSYEETAVAQVRALGFDPGDVRHIVVTHLDVDHAGGMSDFPQARVHVFEPEHEAAMAPTWRERMRYIPAHWDHDPDWVRHRVEGDNWFGFEAVRLIPGAAPDIALIPLPGHTRGHCGVAVASGERWLIHCGDAYFHHAEMQTPPSCPAGLRIFQNLVQVDGRKRLANQQRLRQLQAEHSDTVDLFCAHDPSELQRMQAANG
ncbi:MAG: MBL fold metallo-hydrolase [Panacagrimonas sp.]